MRSTRVTVLAGVVLSIVAAGGSAAAEDGEVVERGAFQLHLYKRPTGRET
jgi:hypothetical protein